MAAYRRFGLYLVPDPPLFAAASAWLGWDCALGQPVAQPDVPNLPEPAETLTARPRKYGVHLTLKAPFFLADGAQPRALEEAVAEYCATRPRLNIPRLEVRRLGRLVALVPSQPCPALTDLACSVVEALDPFRAPPSPSELARRRAARLTERQEFMLQRWGYPHVMEEFRPHITLTGRTGEPDKVAAALSAYFAPHLAQPLHISSLALMGEDAEGFFHILQRSPLA